MPHEWHLSHRQPQRIKTQLARIANYWAFKPFGGAIFAKPNDGRMMPKVFLRLLLRTIPQSLEKKTRKECSRLHETNGASAGSRPSGATGTPPSRAPFNTAPTHHLPPLTTFKEVLRRWMPVKGATPHQPAREIPSAWLLYSCCLCCARFTRPHSISTGRFNTSIIRMNFCVPCPWLPYMCCP